MTSIRDKISDAIAPVYRKLLDVQTTHLGTATQLLKLSKKDKDDFGYSTVDYKEEILTDCILTYPINEIEMFESRVNSNTDVNSISLMEILPIILRIKFEGTDGVDPIEIEKGDILVDVLRDHKANKIPIIMEVEKPTGQFRAKNIIHRKYELSLSKKTYNLQIENKIDDYINNLA